jgi:hypothetical protein
MSGVEDVDAQRRNYRRPHNAHNPIPTIQKYREEKERRRELSGQPEADRQSDEPSRRDRLGDAVNVFRHGREGDVGEANGGNGPYPAINKNLDREEEMADDHARLAKAGEQDPRAEQDQGNQDDQDSIQDTTQGSLKATDPKQARKQMKKFRADGTERPITDPVTHLSVNVHDFTDRDLKSTAKNPPPPGSSSRTMTGANAINKSDDVLREEEQEAQDAHTAMEVLFPPPDFERTRGEMSTVYRQAVTVGVGVVAISLLLVNAVFWSTRRFTGWSRQFFNVAELATMAAIAVAVILFMRQWCENKIRNVWDVEVWRAEGERGLKLAKSQTAESTQWLNSLVASVWPLVNPDLFMSLSDTLEVCPVSL